MHTALQESTRGSPGRFNIRFAQNVKGKEGRLLELDSKTTQTRELWISSLTTLLYEKAWIATTPLDSDANVGWAPSGEKPVPPPAAHGVRRHGFLRAWMEPSGPPVINRTQLLPWYWSIVLDDFTLRRHRREADFRSGADPLHVYPIALVEKVTAIDDVPEAPFCIVVNFENKAEDKKAEIKLLAASASEREAWIQDFSYVMRAVEEKDAEEDVSLGYAVLSEMSPAYLKVDVSRNGTLLLFRRGTNKWVPKFFALVPNDSTLRRFVDARDAFSRDNRPQAVYPLLAVDTVLHGAPLSKPISIVVTFHNGHKVHLGMPSEAERDDWIAAIVACMPDDVNDVDPAPVWMSNAESLVLPLLNSATIVCRDMLSLKLQCSLRVSGKPLYLRRHFVLADGDATGAHSVLLRFASAADVGSRDPTKAPRVYPVRDISRLSRTDGAMRLVVYLREGALPGLSCDETYIDLHFATGGKRDEWYDAISKLLQRDTASLIHLSRLGVCTGSTSCICT